LGVGLAASIRRCCKKQWSKASKAALLAVMSLTVLSACGPKAPDDLRVGPEANVIAVRDDASLKLEDIGLAHLAALDFPHGASAAVERLKPAALGRKVRLFFDGAERDLSGALAGQIYVRDEAGRWRWLQRDLVESGLARVRPKFADRSGAEALLPFEAAARTAKTGVWADSALAVRPADAKALSADIGAFVLVEGKVVSVGRAAHRVFLNFGADYKTDFTVTIPEEAWSAWPGGAPYLLNLKDENVRVRGILTQLNGPSLEAVTPAQIEALGPG